MASGDHFVDCDTVDKVHLELKKILCKDYLDEKSCKWNFDTFKLKSQVYLKSQRERNVSSASEIWDMLESKSKPWLLKAGNYKVLKELVEDIDVYMVNIITEAGERIESIKKSKDNGSSRKRRKGSDGENVGHNTAEHPDRRDALPKYDVKERKRGKVLVFCNVSVQNCHDLDGYKKDAGKLQETFTELQFEVDILNNKNQEYILNELQKCKEMKPDQSAFICCFLSHGGSDAVTKESFFLSSDGKAIYIEDVMAMFTHENCPSLVGKPKIFLVQACRGTEENKGTVAANMEYTGTPHLIPNFSDYLLFNSTVLTHVSWVQDKGSFFIRNFCEKMKEHHSKYDIMTICTLVTGAVAADGNEDFKQVPEIKSTLRKLLFL